MADASESRFARAVRWLSTIRLTLLFCLLLWFVYAIELLVLSTADYETFVALFVARQRPSPGWLLSPLSHSPANAWHLPSNVVQLLAFGGLAERRLDGKRYVGLLAAAGVASVGAQVAVYADAGPAARGVGTLGASGIALATVGFVVVDNLRFRELTGRWRGEAADLWTLLGGLLIGRAVLDLFVGAPGIAVVGHLTGIGLGVVCGLVRTRAAVLRPRFDGG